MHIYLDTVAYTITTSTMYTYIHYYTSIHTCMHPTDLQDKNKQELFEYIADSIGKVETDRNKLLLVTKNDDVLTSSTILSNKEDLGPCTHEEADTRMLLHVKHAAMNGHTTVVIRTVDTDVLVLAIAHFQYLVPHLYEIFMEFGAGKNYRFVIAKIMYLLCSESEHCAIWNFGVTVCFKYH